MNNGIIKVIMVLVAVGAFSGCSSFETQQPILSAAEVQASIRVTVSPLQPIVTEQTVAVLAD